MKKTLKNPIRAFTILLFVIGFAVSALAGGTNPPQPPNSSNNNSSNNIGGSAPIGGGLFILMGLGLAYGGKKIYDLRFQRKGRSPVELRYLFPDLPDEGGKTGERLFGREQFLRMEYILRLLEFTFQSSGKAEPCRTRGRIIPPSFLHFTIEAV